MCAQTIFTALDHLTSWANEKRKSAAARRVKGQAQKSTYVSSQHIYIYMYDFTVWKLAYIYLSRMPAQLVTICQEKKKQTSVITTYKGAKTEYTYIVYRGFNHSVCVLWAEFYIYSCFPTFSTRYTHTHIRKKFPPEPAFLRPFWGPLDTEDACSTDAPENNDNHKDEKRKGVYTEECNYGTVFTAAS